MKKLIRLLLVLVVGMVLGYVFHQPIDAKLKSKFGIARVEKGKQIVEDTVEKGVEKGKKIGDVVVEDTKLENQ